MRADEPMGIHERNKLSIRQDIDYINQLRVERLMAKARTIEYYGEKRFFEFGGTKAPKYIKESFRKCIRIAEALEARARRIKEGM